MFTKKEGVSILIAMIIMAFTLTFLEGVPILKTFPKYFIFAFVIISISVLSKQAVGRVLQIEIKQSIWKWQRFWFTKWAYFKKPIPLGLILAPLFAFLFMFRYFLCFLQYDSKALLMKATKRWGAKRYSEMMEWDDALIVFYSTLPLLITGIIISFFSANVLQEFSKIIVIYAMSNLIPISRLDGTKLFFGSRTLFWFTWILALLSLLPVIF